MLSVRANECRLLRLKKEGHDRNDLYYDEH